MNVLLIEKNALLRETVKSLIENWRKEASVDDFESLEEIRIHQTSVKADIKANPKYELIIAKISDPKFSLEVTTQITNMMPDASIVCLVDTADRSVVQKIIRMGTKGIITSDTSSQEFTAVLELVMAGGVFVPSELYQNIEFGFDVPIQLNQSAPVNMCSLESETLSQLGLSARQIEVLELLCQGQSNKAISHEMCLSINTVKAHLTAIFKVLSVKNRTEAVSMFVKPVASMNNHQRTVSRF